MFTDDVEAPLLMRRKNIKKKTHYNTNLDILSPFYQDKDFHFEMHISSFLIFYLHTAILYKYEKSRCLARTDSISKE